MEEATTIQNLKQISTIIIKVLQTNGIISTATKVTNQKRVLLKAIEINPLAATYHNRKRMEHLTQFRYLVRILNKSLLSQDK